MNNIPLLIQGIGLVLVALLIPIWISLFKGEGKQFGKLDEKVLIDYIFEGKNILAYLGLIFIPPILWYSPKLLMKTYSIIYPILGIYLLFKNVNKALNWISGKKSQLRLDFLDSLQKFENTEEIWHPVWEEKNIDREKEYLDIFFERLEILIKNKKGKHLNVLSDYLRDFKENLENRDLRNILFENYFSKLLDWYHDNWIEREKSKKYRNEYPEWEIEKNFRIKRELREIFEQNWKILIERGALDYFIDNTFKKKINGWQDNKSLLEDLLGSFLNILFEETKSRGKSHFIWDIGFPKEWKITRENWKKRDTILKIIWRQYFIWAFNRFQEATDEVDQELSNVTERLFPKIHYIKWVKILIFEFTRRENLRERFYFMIVRKWSFLMIMSKATFVTEGGESEIMREFEEEKENAFDLAFELFGDDFSKELLKKYISTLMDLEGEFEKDSIYENRRKGILEMFKEIEDYKKSKK